MSKSRSIMTIALSVGMIFAATELAMAQKAKKMSYEEAYKKCQGEVKALYPSEAGPGSRYQAGSACMKRYGFRLKK